MRSAIGFLTTLGGSRSPAPTALRWFPVVGLLIGLLLGGAWWASAEVLPAWSAAVVVVAADLAVTGMLHVDGLGDSADGLLAHGIDRERRLEIMRTPDIGAYGVAAIVLALLARVAGLAALSPDVLLLAGLWTASRTVMAVVPAVVPYARSEGIASGFLERPARSWTAIGVVVAAALAAIGGGWAGFAAVVACVLAAAAVVALAGSRLGGFTGDVLGASAVVGEAVGLVVAGARW